MAFYVCVLLCKKGCPAVILVKKRRAATATITKVPVWIGETSCFGVRHTCLFIINYYINCQYHQVSECFQVPPISRPQGPM